MQYGNVKCVHLFLLMWIWQSMTIIFLHAEKNKFTIWLVRAITYQKPVSSIKKTWVKYGKLKMTWYWLVHWAEGKEFWWVDECKSMLYWCQNQELRRRISKRSKVKIKNFFLRNTDNWYICTYSLLPLPLDKMSLK